MNEPRSITGEVRGLGYVCYEVSGLIKGNYLDATSACEEIGHTIARTLVAKLLQPLSDEDTIDDEFICETLDALTRSIEREFSSYMKAYEKDFEEPIQANQAKAKAKREALNHDDLIEKTANLLSRTDDAQWVFYKLNQGLDRILVDEAQDIDAKAKEALTSAS